MKIQVFKIITKADLRVKRGNPVYILYYWGYNPFLLITIKGLKILIVYMGDWRGSGDVEDVEDGASAVDEAADVEDVEDEETE